MPEKIFEDFLKTTNEDWIKLAQKETKNFEKLFVTSYERIVTQPIYTVEDLIKSNISAPFPIIRKGAVKWQLIEEIVVNDEVEANKIAMEALHGGTDGVVFIITKTAVLLEDLLDNIWVENCILSFVIDVAPAKFLEQLISYFQHKKYDLNKVVGWIEYDPFKSWLVTSKLPKGYEDELKNLLTRMPDIKGLRGLTINSKHFYNSGGTIIHELGFVLSVAVEYIELLIDKGFNAVTIFNNTIFKLTVSTNFFFEISKLRAFRILLSKLAQAYNLEIEPSAFKITTINSIWDKSVVDTENNTIRNCAESMAAIIGGTDYLIITNNNFYPDHSRSRRTLRNISHLLKDEAHLDKVVDPACGSFYIESLTKEIIIKAWEQFLEIEKLGGFKEAVKVGLIEKSIGQTRNQKLHNIDLRKTSIIGTNIYPNSEDQLLGDKDQNEGILKEQRGAEGIERLRLWVSEKFSNNNRKPKAMVSSLAGTAIDKDSSHFLKAIFNSIGFVVDFQPDFRRITEIFGKSEYDVFVCYVDENSLTSANTKFLEESNYKLPLIITSTTKNVIDIGLSDIYLPMEALALHQNLSTILSNLKVAKK